MKMGSEWMLVTSKGKQISLAPTMLFLGNQDCDILLEAPTVEKRHAVITYDHYEKRFKMKDLGSEKGTFVNNYQIPGQSYIGLEDMDILQFGDDPIKYQIRQCLPTDSNQRLPYPDVCGNTLVQSSNYVEGDGAASYRQTNRPRSQNDLREDPERYNTSPTNLSYGGMRSLSPPAIISGNRHHPPVPDSPSSEDSFAASCRAFTVDLGPELESGGSKRRMDIKDSISKYAPHEMAERMSHAAASRNDSKKSLGSSRSSNPKLLQGSLSEGYFSSDPEDDRKGVGRGANKNNNRKFRGSPLIDRRRNTEPINKEPHGKKRNSKESLNKEPHKNSHSSLVSTSTYVVDPNLPPSRGNSSTNNVNNNNINDLSDKSESGTYTVEGDNVELKEARSNIEQVFGLSKSIESTPESKKAVTVIPPAPPASRRGLPGWLREWAHSATPENKTRELPSPPVGGGDVICSPSDEPTPQPPRPRRRLPSLPTETSRLLRDTADVVAVMQRRVSQSRTPTQQTYTTSTGTTRVTSSSAPPPPRYGGSKLYRHQPMSRSVGSFPDQFSDDSASVQSDVSSSSENEETHRTPAGVGQKKQPLISPLRFNRAFNLRRSRLDEPPSKPTPKPKTPAPPSNRPSVTSFSRNDGGRFSLRVPKSSNPTTPRGGALSKAELFKKNQLPARSNSSLSNKEQEFQNWKRRKEYNPLKSAQEARGKQRAQASTPTESNSVQRSASFHGTAGLGAADEPLPTIPVRKTREVEAISSEQFYEQTNSSSPFALASPKQKLKLENMDGLMISSIYQRSYKVKETAKELIKGLQKSLSPEWTRKLEDMNQILGELSEPERPSKRLLTQELSTTLKNLSQLDQCLRGIQRIAISSSTSQQHHPRYPDRGHNF